MSTGQPNCVTWAKLLKSVYPNTFYRLIQRKRRKCLLKTDRRKEIREEGKEGDDDANDGHSNSRKHLQLFPSSETNLLPSLMPHGFEQKHTCTILSPNKAKDKCIESVP